MRSGENPITQDRESGVADKTLSLADDCLVALGGFPGQSLLLVEPVIFAKIRNIIIRMPSHELRLCDKTFQTIPK
jgi:hypothetical protein